MGATPRVIATLRMLGIFPCSCNKYATASHIIADFGFANFMVGIDALLIGK